MLKEIFEKVKTKYEVVVELPLQKYLNAEKYIKNGMKIVKELGDQIIIIEVVAGSPSEALEIVSKAFGVSMDSVELSK